MSDLKNKTAKGLAWGGIFTLLQQAIGVFFAIFLARLLSPSDYGMVGMLSIFSALASLLQDAGFVIVLTNRKGIVKSEYSTVFWFNVIMSLIIYIFFYVSAPLIGSYFNKEQIVPLSRYVFLGFFFSSFGVIQSAVLYKQMSVKEKGIGTLTGIILSGILGIILAINGFAYWGLATQGLFSTIVTTSIMWFYSPFRPSFVLDYKFLCSILPEGLKMILPNLAVTISDNVYSLILGRLYSVKDVGFFSQASRYNTLGYSITLGMIRNVSQPMLVQIKDDKEEFIRAFRKLFRFAALLSIPVMFILALLAPELISFILSSKWYFAGFLLRIMCIGGAFVVFTSLASYLFISLNKSSLYMWLGTVSSLTNIIFAILASIWGVVSLAISVSFLSFFTFVVYFYYVHNLIGYSCKMILNDLIPVLLPTISVVSFVYFTTAQFENILLLLITRIILSISLFLVIMNFLKYDVFEEAKVIIFAKLKSFFSW